MELGCRLSCYGPFQTHALAHLAAVGVSSIELHAPLPEAVDDVCRALAAQGLRASTVQVRLDYLRPDTREQLAPQLAVIAKLGARRLLMAPPPGLTPSPVTDAALRCVAADAEAAGVAALLECHPHVAGNAREAHATLTRVGHPNLRINFDPANIGFYNPGGDPLEELAALGAAIGGVHLKDGSGRFEHRWFPALGEGVVDFPALFARLDALGFTGPFSIEIEPPRDGSATQGSVEAAVAASVEYLRRIGRFPG